MMEGMGAFTPNTFLGLPPDECSPEKAGVLVVPVPFEVSSTYGRGSKQGPATIISASQAIELFDADLACEPHRSAGGIATLPAVMVLGMEGNFLADQLAKEIARWLAAGKFLVTLGGEHTSVVGAIRAHCQHFEDLTVLQLDAHSDLREKYQGHPWNHACTMSRVLDFHSNIVAAGIRSETREERQRATERGITVIPARSLHENGGNPREWITQVIDATRQNVYVTFDCDVMDPAIVPATGTPEPGGMTWQQVDTLFERLCRERNLVGLDVSELAPIKGLIHPEFTIAKLVHRIIGYRFRDAHEAETQTGSSCITHNQPS
jgi:agmatinase